MTLAFAGLNPAIPAMNVSHYKNALQIYLCLRRPACLSLEAEALNPSS